MRTSISNTSGRRRGQFNRFEPVRRLADEREVIRVFDDRREAGGPAGWSSATATLMVTGPHRCLAASRRARNPPFGPGPTSR